MAKSFLKSIKETGRHSIIYGIGNILSKGIGILLVPLHVNNLTISEDGTLSLMILTLSLGVPIFKLGLDSALFRSYYDYKTDEERNKVISTSYITLLICFQAYNY